MTSDRILIGTSGWVFDDWAGVFYPLRVPKTRWLEYYSARFSIGELNSSYYRIPSQSSFAGMAEKTPDSFRMLVKAHSDVTHERRDPRTSLETLVRNVQPLRDSGKLLGLLLQFPASFHHNSDNSKYLIQLFDFNDGIQLCVEFRHSSWDIEEVREFMRTKNLVWVCPDEPRLPNLLPPQVYKTGKFIYIRMHGRNSAAWYEGNGEERYNYHYSDQELSEWIANVQSTDFAAENVYVLFNNCRSGNAIMNALRLRQMLLESIGQSETGEIG